MKEEILMGIIVVVIFLLVSILLYMFLEIFTGKDNVLGVITYIISHILSVMTY